MVISVQPYLISTYWSTMPTGYHGIMNCSRMYPRLRMGTLSFPTGQAGALSQTRTPSWIIHRRHSPTQPRLAVRSPTTSPRREGNLGAESEVRLIESTQYTRAIGAHRRQSSRPLVA